jgi:hypothetical protein
VVFAGNFEDSREKWRVGFAVPPPGFKHHLRISAFEYSREENMEISEREESLLSKQTTHAFKDAVLLRVVGVVFAGNFEDSRERCLCHLAGKWRVGFAVPPPGFKHHLRISAFEYSREAG